MGAGTCGIWERREEAQRPLHETFRLVEARLVRHAPGGSMPSQALKHCKIQSRRDAPKVAILEVRAPKMRLVEAQCARQKHCYLETPLGSDLISRVLQLKIVCLDNSSETIFKGPPKINFKTSLRITLRDYFRALKKYLSPPPRQQEKMISRGKLWLHPTLR